MTICSVYAESIAGAVVGETVEGRAAIAFVLTTAPIVSAADKKATEAELGRNVINIAFRQS